MGCQFPGLVAELAEAALKIAGGGEDSTLPVRCGHCDQFPNLVDGEFAPQIAILGRQSLYGKYNIPLDNSLFESATDRILEVLDLKISRARLRCAFGQGGLHSLDVLCCEKGDVLLLFGAQGGENGLDRISDSAPSSRR